MWFESLSHLIEFIFALAGVTAAAAGVALTAGVVATPNSAFNSSNDMLPVVIGDSTVGFVGVGAGGALPSAAT